MFRILLSSFFVLVMTASQILAAGLSKPTGPVILTVTGNIQATNNGDQADFDRQMLIDLGFHSIRTSTPWHESATVFEGPSGKSLMDALGVQAGTAKVKALNDYVAAVPIADFLNSGLILAMKANNQMLRVRDKGPLFIVYPYDDKPELKNDKFYTRSVWQIRSIHVE